MVPTGEMPRDPASASVDPRWGDWDRCWISDRVRESWPLLQPNQVHGYTPSSSTNEPWRMLVILLISIALRRGSMLTRTLAIWR